MASVAPSDAPATNQRSLPEEFMPIFYRYLSAGGQLCDNNRSPISTPGGIMKRTAALLVIASVGLVGTAYAQPKGAPQPALAACGSTVGTAEVLCGTRSPEDLELTPDGKLLIVSQFVNNRGAAGE